MKARFLHFAARRSRGGQERQGLSSGAGTTRATLTLKPQNGWHWMEWLAEGAGTTLLLFAVVTAKYLAVRAGPPLSSFPWRTAIVALTAGVTVFVVAVSVIGRRSGAHLNPALTFGLWLQRTVSSADLAGYVIAQLSGAVLGVALARLWGPAVTRAAVDWAVVRPAVLVPQPAAAGLECGAVLVQLSLVFILLSSWRHHQWAPAASGAMLAVTVIALAPVSGGGINPARALAPDDLARAYPGVWVYLAGPLLGAALAAAAMRAVGRQPVTGKLRHDPSIECHMRCKLPGPPGHGPDQAPGELGGSSGPGNAAGRHRSRSDNSGQTSPRRALPSPNTPGRYSRRKAAAALSRT